MKKYLNTFWANLVITLTMASICAWLASVHNWLWLTVAVPCLLVAVWKFYRLYTFHVRKVAFLLDAIENDDPAVHFYERVPDKDSSQVNIMLNRIATILYNVKQETVQREKYYELILDFVETGIVVMDENGSVVQKNRKALQILGMEVLTHVRQLYRVSEVLGNAFSQALPGDKCQVECSTGYGLLTLSLRVSEITVHEKALRIIALTDINHELDEREIDSWIRLTRVLTHEIMNSLTPVTSLSETLLTLPGAEREEMRQGLETIRTTGQGLINFVTSYRKLTRLPVPEPALFEVRPFMERMRQLAHHQHASIPVQVTLQKVSDELMAYADENLMTQVMVNLIKNAMQAIGNRPDGHIRLSAYCDTNDTVHIEVSNNGPHIPPEMAEQIFIPFFTTKEDGSGIGLSLSKQMMRLQGGSLSLLPYSLSGEWTTFVVTLS